MINKSELMSKAWEIYRSTKEELTAKINKEQYFTPKYPTHMPTHRIMLANAMDRAWSIMKTREIKIVESKKEKKIVSKSGRYLELYVVAEVKKLNHGSEWFCSAKNVDGNSLNPSWEGEKVCYVYA